MVKRGRCPDLRHRIVRFSPKRRRSAKAPSCSAKSRKYWWTDVYHPIAQRAGGRRHEDWYRAAQPICARIPSNQSSTRWQVAEDQGEAQSSERTAAAARVRQNWILCTDGLRRSVPLVVIVLCCALMLSAAPQQAQSPSAGQGNVQAPDPNFELPGRPPAGAQGPGLPTGPTLAPEVNGAAGQPAAPATNNAGAQRRGE